ncbi:MULTISPECIES: DUF5130 family protein [unclassified Amycolatopsis]|uniref:DUF5130 family protein n=1 Tax=unclassified Amycolatopsis TaxID=2618356 RepID=UPI002874C461|nr:MULTISPECIES: DUF5130 family protein [unclassified Amycolatopsis]MDS0136240.1 DUF5130 family protein [Amycolatopsis sp. 505]MDS0145755.1 DUF5130 family protein [Amycolatopsis sp. CM201R]
MATGELTKRVDESELGYGEALMATGRVSAAKMYEPEAPSGPFNTRQLARLDEALTFASRETGLDFSLYLGELGAESRETAEKLHATTADPSNSVLIAVSPGERKIEIVTGKAAYVRLPDRGAKLAVASMVASFKEGDLVRGLVNGLVNALRMLSDQAGPAPR